MTTWTLEHSDQLRAALRSTAESDPHERLRRALARGLVNVKARRRQYSSRTSTQALMLLSSARRPAWRGASVVAAAGDATRVHIDGEIGWDATEADLRDQLKGAGAVDLRVNSPGGDVWEGLAMYNALRDHPGPVTVNVVGLAASAASFIAMAGDRVVMHRGAQMMIHDAMTVTGGNEADHLRSAELLRRISDTIAGLYAGRMGVKVADVRDLMRAETWYSGPQAVAAGLADEAVEAKVDAVALAAAVRSAFR